MTVTCPTCKTEGRVANTRMKATERMRRRVCDSCGYRWTTFEISEVEYKQLKGASRTLHANVRVRRRALASNPALRIA